MRVLDTGAMRLAGLWLTLAAPVAGARPAWGFGEESFGNSPVGDNPEWSRGVLAVANHPSRVYRRWINGNESFFFAGAAADLNAALEAFAARAGLRWMSGSGRRNPAASSALTNARRRSSRMLMKLLT